MKRNYILLAALLMAGGSVCAQKLSPNTTLMLMDNSTSVIGVKSTDQNETYIEAFIHLSDASVVDELKALGVTVQSVLSDRLVTAAVPMSAIGGVADLSGVEYIQAGSEARLLMDEARKDCNVDACHTATADMGAYTGKGVVVGIVDNGFQYSHVDFMTSDGKSTRVKRVWDQNTTGKAPKNYDYGTEYTELDEMKAAKYDMTSTFHASHVTGIAAGADKASGYYGVAPDADLVLVSFKNATTNIVDGIKYVFDYAESVGKPCVVNISLGQHLGPHDGTSATDQAFAEMTGPGRIIVGACGNEGSENLHATKTFTESDKTMKVMLGYGSSTSSTKTSYVDIWGSKDTDIKVKTVVVENLRGKIVAESPEVSVGGTTETKYTFPDGSNAVATVQMAATRDASNNCPDVLLMCRATSITEGYKLGIVVTGEAGSTVHMWNCASNGVFLTPNKRGWTDGDNNCTVGELGGTGEGVISVGSYNTKLTYTTIGDGTYEANTDLVGKLHDISSFSSIGPTVDGRTKPDVAAPGCAIVSATSRYYASFSASTSVAQSGSDYYDINIGTSMASPFVTGTVALWLQANPNLTPAQVRNIIQKTSRHDDYTGEASTTNYVWGAGKIDALAGLKEAIAYTTGIDDPAQTAPLFRVETDSRSRTARFFFADAAGTADVAVYNAVGQQVAAAVVTGNGQSLDLSTLASGVYLFRMQRGSQVQTLKVAL